MFARDDSHQAPSLVERVCACVRHAVAGGHLSRGDRLPATRTLASDLGVSRVTAEAAYSRLEAEGYVQRRSGSGTYIAIDASSVLSIRTRRIAGDETASLSKRGEALVASGGCVDARDTQCFTAGFPDLQAFPADTWRKITARVLRGDIAQLLAYGDPQGEESLRVAIAAYLSQSRGVNCTAEQVVITTSSQQALSLIGILLVDVGDSVWLENPCYPGARAAFVSAGAKVEAIPVDHEGMCAPPAGSLPTPKVVYLTPSHQYPTGSTLSLRRRMDLLTRSDCRRTWIVEDDYDSEFRYGSKAVPALQGLDTDGRVIYLGTFSKSLFPSLRLAYLVLPRALVQPFVITRTTQDGHPGRLQQAVTAEFLANGHFTAHLRQMRTLYQGRREVLLHELAKHAPGLTAAHADDSAGLQLTVTAPVRSDQIVARRALQRHGLALRCLSNLYLTDAQAQGWILGFAALDASALRQGSKAFGIALRGARL